MGTATSTPVFINLSNHLSTGWSEQQLLSAQCYGTIVDMQFPPVNPEMKTDQVHSMADELVAAIMEYSEPADLTVHVMGEMTLTYSIVAALHRLGVRCVASTTERHVTEVDGKKVSEFHFVQFREY